MRSSALLSFFILSFFVCISLPLQAKIIKEKPSAKFLNFISDVKKEALAKGIKQETLDQAFQNISYLKVVIARDRNQPEIKQSYANYLEKRVSEWRINRGQKMMTEHAALLDKVSKQYGVQPRFMAAIWGIETNYGTVTLGYSVFDALATLAFDPRRSKRFRLELFDVLHILDQGHAGPEQMRSSWAGAMGQPQFMPAAYRKYAQDFDQDGKKDIWTNHGDIFASIANYLKKYGLDQRYTWGRAVLEPKQTDNVVDYIGQQADGAAPSKVCKPFKSLGQWKNLSEWQDMGFRRLNGTDLPDVDILAAYVKADEGDQTGFLVYHNFCVLMRYNPSFKYALGVGLLSDKIK